MAFRGTDEVYAKAYAEMRLMRLEESDLKQRFLEMEALQLVFDGIEENKALVICLYAGHVLEGQPDEERGLTLTPPCSRCGLRGLVDE